jgi:hypothetical protein
MQRSAGASRATKGSRKPASPWGSGDGQRRNEFAVNAVTVVLLQALHGNATCANCGSPKRRFRRNISTTGVVSTPCVAPAKQGNRAIFVAKNDSKKILVLLPGKCDMLPAAFVSSVRAEHATTGPVQTVVSKKTKPSSTFSHRKTKIRMADRHATGACNWWWHAVPQPKPIQGWPAHEQSARNNEKTKCLPRYKPRLHVLSPHANKKGNPWKAKYAVNKRTEGLRQIPK